MNRILAILSYFVLTSFFTQAWGESRYVIEAAPDVVSNKTLSDTERCMKAFGDEDYDNAYTACLKTAEQGDTSAQFNLGVMYYNGNGVKQDYEEAATWFHKAAEQGYAEAQYNLGLLYAKGLGVKLDYSEAAKWSRKAAGQGISYAQYNLGLLYENGQGVKQNYAEAVSWFRKAAEQGNAIAQSHLGGMYVLSRGVKQDYAEAMAWFRKAAEQGDVDAQLNLGLMYENGWGVKQDYAEAAAWYRKAAEKGNAFAQFDLGSMYNKGLISRGVRLEYAEAADWYRKAAEQGYAEAQLSLGLLYENGWGVKQDYTEAASWYRKAAEQGVAKAQFHLGWMYFFGRGVKKDFTEAKLWSRKAAEQSDARAQFLLAMLLKQNYPESAAWLRKAAEQGLDDAQYFLGCLYYMGKGVKQDPNEAAGWFRKAADQGNAKAKLALDQLYKGAAEATSWYRHEAEQGDSDAQYELAKSYINGEGIEKNRQLAEKWLFQSISKDETNEKSIMLLENEFGWHCILTEDKACVILINSNSIKRDLNLSWYWTVLPGNITKSKQYEVINCKNGTIGVKSQLMLDDNFDVIPDRNITVEDSEIKFIPLNTGTAYENLLNIVCGNTSINNKVENVQEFSFGTGWPIQPGYIVTNQHVVNGKKNITVMLTTGEKISAKILIEDKINDLALLLINQPGKLPPSLPVARSSAKTGSKVFTIGYPHPDMMGTKPKLTEGIVNAVTGYMDDPRTLQISVPVQAGNSGGPLLNMNGEVIGIVTAKLSAVKMFNWTGDLPQNVNYAVKTPYLSALIGSVGKQSSRTKTLPAKPASLESLSSRIQNSILMIIAE